MTQTAPRVALAIMVALSIGEVQALQKCVDRLGKVTYTDEACTAGHKAVKVETFNAPAAGVPGIDPPPDPAGPKSSLPDSSDRTAAMKAYIDASQSARKRIELADEIRRGETSISDLQRTLDGELRVLREAKTRAGNNLAGATWEISLSNEMSALTNRYDSRIRVAQDRLENARRQLASLK